MKARLTDLAHLYCGEEIDSRDFAFHGECFRALNSLRSNKNIVITKQDIGSGEVILNKNDFIDKMLVILDDTSKFEKLGPTSSNDNTANIKSKLQKRLLELFKEDTIPKSLYQNIRPTGSQTPRMYDLPKTHKTNVPLRPILSMTGSSHHELSKWLASLLEPVLKRFSTHCIRDSFTFADAIQNSKDSNNLFMCSFDISSLFTNVPLEETINICADALYCDDSDAQPLISKAVFIELMKSATSRVEFSFNDIMYKQIDGVAMGSPLGPALANIFVGFYEEKLFSQISKPSTYFRYVDNTFAMFRNEEKLENFFKQLNCLHLSLKFTFEKEKNNCLPFLDVNVERTVTGFETSVYRKPIFTGQYLRWESFSPTKQKTNLISTLVHRALMIYTKSKLNEKLKHIKNILLDNGYPESIIDCNISKKIARFSMPKRFGPEKCPVHLRVPWIGKASIGLDKNVKTAVESCYGSVTTRVVFISKRMLPVARKDVLPTTLKSSVVYEYSCHRDSRYVGRTSQ